MSANIRSKRAAEVRRVVVDFSQKLLTAELLSGTPTVQEVGSAGLTITNIEVSAFTEDMRTLRWASWPWTLWPQPIAIYTAVAFTVSGGVAGRDYRLRITVGTDATAAQTLIQEITFRVN